jgi:hypothetical protein
MTRGSKRWAASCLFLGPGHRDVNTSFSVLSTCRGARRGIGLSAPCFFLPFIFIPHLSLQYRSCQCIILMKVLYNSLLTILVDITAVLMKVLYNSSRDPKRFLFLIRKYQLNSFLFFI